MTECVYDPTHVHTMTIWHIALD